MTNTHRVGSRYGEPGSGPADTAREQARELGDTVAEAGSNVASVARDEVAGVAEEVRTQAGHLFAHARQELSDQAATQKDRVSAGLETLGGDLGEMAQHSSSNGVAAGLVRQASDRATRVANWIGQRDPEDILNEVRSFARRRPGTFIAIAAVAGVVVGRLTRSIATNAAASSGTTSSGTTPADTTSTGTSSTRTSSTAKPEASGMLPTVAPGPGVGAADHVAETPVYSSLVGDPQGADHPDRNEPIVGSWEGRDR